NDGGADLVDVYFGVRLPPEAGPAYGCPAGDAVGALTDALTRATFTCLSGASVAGPPAFRNVVLPASLPETIVSSFFQFVWPASAPAGDYGFVMTLTRPGSLDVKAMATEIVRFRPSTGPSVEEKASLHE